MLRTTFTKVARPALLTRATFSTTSRAMGAGDTGSPPKTGGQGCVSLSEPKSFPFALAEARGLGSGSCRINCDTALRQPPKLLLASYRHQCP